MRVLELDALGAGVGGAGVGGARVARLELVL